MSMPGGKPMRAWPRQIQNKEARRLVKRAIHAGWKFDMTAGSHGRLRSPDGRSTVIFPGTSRHPRGLLNMRAELRRAGLEVQ